MIHSRFGWFEVIRNTKKVDIDRIMDMKARHPLKRPHMIQVLSTAHGIWKRY